MVQTDVSLRCQSPATGGDRFRTPRAARKPRRHRPGEKWGARTGVARRTTVGHARRVTKPSSEAVGTAPAAAVRCGGPPDPPLRGRGLLREEPLAERGPGAAPRPGPGCARRRLCARVPPTSVWHGRGGAKATRGPVPSAWERKHPRESQDLRSRGAGGLTSPALGSQTPTATRVSSAVPGTGRPCTAPVPGS